MSDIKAIVKRMVSDRDVVGLTAWITLLQKQIIKVADEAVKSSNDKKLLEKWIKDIGKDEPKVDLQNHVVKHALEIFEERHEKNPESWAASMLNLVDIYLVIRGVGQPEVELRIQKLLKKHLSDPQRYKGTPNAD